MVVCTGGTADIPVAEEAAQTAEYFGCVVDRIYDVGVAGIHRLLSKRERLSGANCIVAAAGMEGALGTVVAGLVECPGDRSAYIGGLRGVLSWTFGAPHHD